VSSRPPKLVQRKKEEISWRDDRSAGKEKEGNTGLHILMPLNGQLESKLAEEGRNSKGHQNMSQASGGEKKGRAKGVTVGPFKFKSSAKEIKTRLRK